MFVFVCGVDRSGPVRGEDDDKDDADDDVRVNHTTVHTDLVKTGSDLEGFVDAIIVLAIIHSIDRSGVSEWMVFQPYRMAPVVIGRISMAASTSTTVPSWSFCFETYSRYS